MLFHLSHVMYIFNEIWNGILMKKTVEKEKKITFSVVVVRVSGGELLKIWLLDNHLLDIFWKFKQFLFLFIHVHLT